MSSGDLPELQRPATTRTKLAFALMLASTGLLMGVILGEWILAEFSPQLTRVPHVWRFDPNLGWNHIPSASGRLVTPEFDVEVQINADGLRDRAYPMEKGAATRRILLFGDSFAEGWGVEIDRSVSQVLEQSLNRRDEAVEVLNFGVAGFGSDQELLLFRQKGRLYEADVVLLLFYGNDLWNNVARHGIGAERGEKPYFRFARAGGLSLQGVPVRKNRYWDFRDGTMSVPWTMRLGRYFSQNWHGFALLEKAFAAGEVTKGEQRTFYQGLYGADRGQRHERSWELTAKILEAFQRAVEAEGSAFVLVYVPSIVQIDEGDWQSKRQLHGLIGEEYDLLKPNRLLGEIAAAAGMQYLDLYPSFRSGSESGPLYYGDSHWNAAGHELAAGQIAEFLVQRGFTTGATKE